MGMISLIGNIAAFIGPYAVGYVRDATGSFFSGMLILGGEPRTGGLLASRIKVTADLTRP